MLDIACGKSGHSSALLNVNLTFQFLDGVLVNIFEVDLLYIHAIIHV